MKYLFLISGSQQTGTFLGIRGFLFFWQNTDFEKEMACVYSLYAGVILVSLQRISSFPLSPSFSLSLSVSFFALSLIHSLLHPSSFALMLIHDQGTSLSKRQMTSNQVLFSTTSLHAYSFCLASHSSQTSRSASKGCPGCRNYLGHLTGCIVAVSVG